MKEQLNRRKYGVVHISQLAEELKGIYNSNRQKTLATEEEEYELLILLSAFFILLLLQLLKQQ